MFLRSRKKIHVHKTNSNSFLTRVLYVPWLDYVIFIQYFPNHLEGDLMFTTQTPHTNLKAHRHISKKRCLKYCSCDKACQFSALQGTHWRSYLENLPTDDKFRSKWVRIFIHQTMWRTEKQLCWSLILIQIIAKFLRAPILKSICERLL